MKLHLMSMEELDKIVRSTAQPTALREAARRELYRREKPRINFFASHSHGFTEFNYAGL